MAELVFDDLERIRADVSLRSARVADFGLIDLRTGSPVFGDPVAPDASGFGDDGYLLVVEGSRRLIDGSLSAADLAVEVARYLQDALIDELGAGWPEVFEGGRFVTLLQPGIRGGLACWVGSDKRSIRFGELWSLGESNS